MHLRFTKAKNMTFPSHDQETAPEASKPLLEASQKAFGRLPGLHKVLAESPSSAHLVLREMGNSSSGAYWETYSLDLPSGECSAAGCMAET